MSGQSFAPYVRDIREAITPFLDGSVDPGDLDIAKAKLDEVVTRLGEELEKLIDEPDEQEVLRKIVAALTLAEFSIQMGLM